MDNGNLFLDAMDTETLKSITEIKANKAFALKLINDLDRIFQTNHEIRDEQNGVNIRMKTSPRVNWYNAFQFLVNEKGIRFKATIISSYKGLGDLYEKYKDCGTTCANGFLEEGYKYGEVKFYIPINRNGDGLKDTLKDIIRIMESNGYCKRF